MKTAKKFSNTRKTQDQRRANQTQFTLQPDHDEMSSSEPQPVLHTETRPPNPSISAHDPVKQNMLSPFIETLQDTSSFDETPQRSCQLSIQDTWVRTWKVKRPGTPRGHTHDQGTSQRQGHLGGHAHNQGTSQGHGHLRMRTLGQGAHL